MHSDKVRNRTRVGGVVDEDSKGITVYGMRTCEPGS
jgi:hypothetical protein